MKNTPISISGLGLSARSYNALHRSGDGIKTIGELCSMTSHDILKMKNIGRMCLKEIKEALARNGLGLIDQLPPRGVPINPNIAPEILTIAREASWAAIHTKALCEQVIEIVRQAFLGLQTCHRELFDAVSGLEVVLEHAIENSSLQNTIRQADDILDKNSRKKTHSE